MYWPNMAADITKVNVQCPTCEEDSPTQAKEVGMDLFQGNVKDYLVVVDYLTDFFEVAELSNALASAVVNVAKQ